MFSIRANHNRFLAALALVAACAAAARAQTPPPSKESLTLDRARLLAQKQTLEESSRKSIQESLENNKRSSENSRKRVEDLNKLWKDYLRQGITDVDGITKAIKQEQDRVKEVQAEGRRLQAALDAINTQLADIDRRVARVDEQLAGIDKAERDRDADKFKYVVTIDAGYASTATFSAARYNDASRFRKALDAQPHNFSNVSGPEHPFTGDYRGVTSEWVVSYWVDRALPFKSFATQQEAEECQKKLLRNGLHAHWDKVAK